MSDLWDSPNQQVVRDDQSGPGVPGDTSQQAVSDLDSMTKADLLAYGRKLGISPMHNDMTKDEIRQAIEAA